MAASLAALVACAMVGGILLTDGRSQGEIQRVVSSIDEAGTDTVVVKADQRAALRNSLVDHVAQLDAVEDVEGFGPVNDCRNASIPQGQNVALRALYLSNSHRPPLTGYQPDDAADVYASQMALKALGMPVAAGAVESSGTGMTYSIAHELVWPSSVSSLQPLLVQPTHDPNGALSVLVVTVRHAADVASVSTALQSLIDVSDPTLVTIQTSAQLASIRGTVESELRRSGWLVVSGLVALGSFLVAMIAFAGVLGRRREFGRRRALGATRAFVAGLVIVQSASVALLGGLTGTAIASVALLTQNDPLPPSDYFLASLVIVVASGMAASAVPAVVASGRDPLREIRVP